MNDYVRFYDGTSTTANLLAELTGNQIPSNVSSCYNEMHVVFYSSSSGTSAGYFARIHLAEIPHPGEFGYCTSSCPCEANQGHCESNDQCNGDLVCGFRNCKSALGFSNGTNCCYNTNDYCSEFLSGENGTWTIQTPVNNSNEYVAEVTCGWYIDVKTNSYKNGFTACGSSVSDFSCCTSTNPCVAGDGHCDSDSECGSGLTCGTDNCGSAFPYSFDCCVAAVDEVVANIAIQLYEVSFIYNTFPIVESSKDFVPFRLGQAF